MKVLSDSSDLWCIPVIVFENNRLGQVSRSANLLERSASLAQSLIVVRKDGRNARCMASGILKEPFGQILPLVNNDVV